MSSFSVLKISVGVAAATLVAFSLVAFAGTSAQADVPAQPIAADFQAPTCAGGTATEPTLNTGFAVEDLTQVFGERLVSYNAGSVVPLYDSFGGSILLNADGSLNEGDMSAYPPLCGTRYVEAAGGVGAPVSEWMYCTDRASQTCGDTDSAGNLVDHDGQPVAPMAGLPVDPATGSAANPKLTADQEKIIAYLVQNGHAYVGVGDQSWGGVTQARSDVDTNSRLALQTLVWCISDPATDDSNFGTTCANNMNADEQARILAMTPDVPELLLDLDSSAETLVAGGTAEFVLTTNVFNQAIEVVTGGTATATWSVCSGDAVLDGSTLTVNGTNTNVSADIVLCATASTAGTATVSMSATPASTQHIGWAQSVNAELEPPCQVYATFHAVQLSAIGDAAEATFSAATTPTTDVPTDGTAVVKTGTGSLADTGSSDQPVLWLGAGLALAGILAVAGALRRRRLSV